MTIMYTTDDFIAAWRHLHHPAMSVDGDVASFHRLYVRVREAVGPVRHLDDRYVLSLLLYAENIIAIGLDGVYEYEYRLLGDVVFRWCDRLGLDATATSRVHGLVCEAVAEAGHSSLRRWVTESVLSGDFLGLCGMLGYFAREDRVIRRVYPDLRHRRSALLRLTGDRATATGMLWVDMAFNWRDKRGRSLPETIAGQLRLVSFPADEREKALSLAAAESLATIRSDRPGAYTVIGREDAHTLTLRRGDGKPAGSVIFPEGLPKDLPGAHLTACLVTYRGKTYACGPVAWLPEESKPFRDIETLWEDVERKEREAARHAYFITPFGKRVSLYEDLYVLPADPEESRLSGMGIYLDEPSILDFLEWMRPEGTVSGTAG